MVKFGRFLSKIKLPRIRISLAVVVSVVVLIAGAIVSLFFVSNYKTRFDKLSGEYAILQNLYKNLYDSNNELKNQDQVKINGDLKLEIVNIKSTYSKAVNSYENLVKLKEITTSNTQNLDNLFADSLTYLSNRNYASASATLSELDSKIKTEKEKQATVSAKIAANVPSSNTAPGSGYSRQSVTSGAGNFMVSMVAADIGSIKVIVDTASDSDCGNNCPVLPLATYVSRNGAFAGVNGTYFCPASYPTCAGKTNTFDLLVMNKNKYYFNSGNNVYSSNPAVIFGNGYVRFVSAASLWGRDTGVDGVLSNFPLLIQGGNVVYGGDSDPKQTSRGGRGFVANKGNTVYIGVVHSASVSESAQTLKALGMENALNLDDGGSTALWSGGYKVGPGRDLPNVILFIKK